MIEIKRIKGVFMYKRTSTSSFRDRKKSWVSLISAFMTTSIVALSPHGSIAQEISIESLIVVDCLLPGQVRQLGPKSKFITPRRPIKTSARSCAIRGGEYVSYDRADYQTALKVWMADAKTGDAKAQTYVAEIYERGLGTDPNYVEAAKWYHMASEQNYKPAQLSLGRLFEQGLGVEKNLLSALNLYRSANGLKNDKLSFVSDMQSAAKSGTAEELKALKKQVKELEQSNERLRRQFIQSTKQAQGSADLVQQLENDIAMKQRLLQDARSQEDLAPVVQNLQSQVDTLEQQLINQESRAELEKRSLRRRISAAESAIENAKMSDNSEELIALMKGQLSDQQRQIAEARSVADAHLDRANSSIADLTEQLRVAKKNSQSASLVNQLNSKIENQKILYEQETDRYEATILAFKQELATQKEKFIAAKKQDDSKSIIKLLEEQIKRQQNDLTVASLDYADLQADLAKAISVRKAQAEQLKDRAGAEKVIASLRNEIKKQTKLLESESKRNKKLIAKVNSQAKQLANNESNRDLAINEGPTIVLKVPPIVASRGLNEVAVQPGQQVYLAGGVVVPSGLQSFTLNGEPAELDVNNLFMIQVDIQNQAVPMELKIVDSQGRESTKNLVLKPTVSDQQVSAKSKPSKKMKWGKYHALVIGNNDYADPKWTNLSNAVNDAKTVARVLEKKYGFETTLLLNAKRVDMLQAIESMRNKLTEDDNLLIYYAGHGQRDDANNRAYWIPVDSSAESSTNWIPSYQVTDHVNAMNARHVLLVVDSCYAGLMTRASGVNAMLVGMTAEQKEQKIKDRLKQRTRMLITAGDNTEVLDAGKQGDHSIFAEAFIGALENNSGVLASEGVFKIVQPYVSKHTYRINKQSVVYAPIPRARHEGGEFYFSPVGGG